MAGAAGAPAADVTDIGVGSSAWLGHVHSVAKPKPGSWLSANITSVNFIGFNLYLQPPTFRLLFLTVAASVSPPQPSAIFNAKKSTFTPSIFLSTSDPMLMVIMTNLLVNPNVIDLPRACPARNVRKHDP